MKQRKFETRPVADVPGAIKLWWVLLALGVGLAGFGIWQWKTKNDAWAAEQERKTQEWDATTAAILEHRRKAERDKEEEKARERRAYEFSEKLRQASAGQHYMSQVLADDIERMKQRQEDERQIARAKDALAMEEALYAAQQERYARERERERERQRT